MLEIVHFDGRAGGGAPEGCARYLMCRCEHILNAKSSRDAFVAAQRHQGHFCGCVMHRRATQGSCVAQDGAFDGRAVVGAPGAIVIYGAITNTLSLMTAKRSSRDAFSGVTKSQVQSFSAVVCMGRPLRAHVLIEIWRILMGERSLWRTKSCARY